MNSELATLRKQVQQIAKALAKVTKPEDAGSLSAWEQLLKSAEGFRWPDFLEALRAESAAVQSKHAAGLQSRREKLLQAARAANFHYEDGTRSIRVNIFRIEFEGEAVGISLGGVPVDHVKESDGDKVFAHIRDLRQGLEQSPFNRDDFFKVLKSGYAICRRASSADEFVPLRDLHREVLIERARRTDAFRRNPEPKNVPPYPLHQFVFDLARFVQGGNSVGSERLATTTPSMRENKDTVFLPNLDHPTGTETAAARLAIKSA